MSWPARYLPIRLVGWLDDWLHIHDSRARFIWLWGGWCEGYDARLLAGTEDDE